jgi:hypothetical protein
MSAPQSLAMAAMNRLAARLGSGLADAAATLASSAIGAEDSALDWISAMRDSSPTM